MEFIIAATPCASPTSNKIAPWMWSHLPMTRDWAYDAIAREIEALHANVHTFIVCYRLACALISLKPSLSIAFGSRHQEVRCLSAVTARVNSQPSNCPPRLIMVGIVYCSFVFSLALSKRYEPTAFPFPRCCQLSSMPSGLQELSHRHGHFQLRVLSTSVCIQVEHRHRNAQSLDASMPCDQNSWPS